jgi:DNA-binding NtrC family response regulator
MRLYKRRVLVADDDDCVRTLCVTALRREGYLVESVVDGREALKKLDHGEYHAVVLDLGMPHVHGATVLSVIAKTRPEMLRRIIVLTGAPDAVIEPIMGLVSGILRKPADLDTLTRYVDQSGEIADDTARLA